MRRGRDLSRTAEVRGVWLISLCVHWGMHYTYRALYIDIDSTSYM